MNQQNVHVKIYYYFGPKEPRSLDTNEMKLAENDFVLSGQVG